MHLGQALSEVLGLGGVGVGGAQVPLGQGLGGPVLEARAALLHVVALEGSVDGEPLLDELGPLGVLLGGEGRTPSQAIEEGGASLGEGTGARRQDCALVQGDGGQRP